MSRVAGICYIKVDGEQLEVSGGVEAPLLDTMRETVMGLAGPAGFKETAQRPFVKLTAIFVSGFPLAKLQSSTDMTVTAELPNGKVYTLSGAFIEGEPSAKGDDGTIELEFGGKKGQWQ
ncbi:MAG: phage tail protein [Burkholderiales bacterium]|nr:MAG: phage tail protein [Burkholderiales bacterium]